MNPFYSHFHEGRTRALERRLALFAIVSLFLFVPAKASESPANANSSGTSFSFILAGIARADGISYASLIDRQTDRHYVLSTQGGSEEGWALDSVFADDNPRGPAAIVEKNGARVFLKLGVPLESQADSPASVTAAAPVVPAQVPGPAGIPQPPKGAALPLVFKVDATSPDLSREQQATIKQLRQDFIAALGGTNSSASASNANDAAQSATASSPATPAARLKWWQTAQEQSDELFKMQFGSLAFNLSQMGIAK